MRNRRRQAVGAALTAGLAAVLLLVALACGGGSAPTAQSNATRAPFAITTAPALMASPETISTATPSAEPSPTAIAHVVIPAIQPDPSRLQPAQVVRVIDGDTIVVRIGGGEEHVRYYGLDTPEVGQPCSAEATDRNRALVGQSVQLLPDTRNRDRYGRLLRYVFDASGASVDARLIGEGFAHAWRQDGAYRDELIALEDEAHTAAIGCLWATAAP